MNPYKDYYHCVKCGKWCGRLKLYEFLCNADCNDLFEQFSEEWLKLHWKAVKLGIIKAWGTVIRRHSDLPCIASKLTVVQLDQLIENPYCFMNERPEQ